MDRPTRRKAGLALAIVATLAAVPAPASAAPSAGDEYVLEIPGVRQAENLGTESAGERSERTPTVARVQRGAVGETDPAGSSLAALGSTAAATPTSLLVGIVALVALALATALPRRHAPGAL